MKRKRIEYTENESLLFIILARSTTTANTIQERNNMKNCPARQRIINTRSSIAQILALCYINIIPTLLAIVGNAFCITALVKTPSLQTISNTWVGALCIIDVIVGIIAQPVYYASLISVITGEGIHDIWMAGRNTSIVLSNTSFFLAYFVTIDRYAAICHPYWYARVAAKKWCVLGTVLGFLLSIPANIFDDLAPNVFRYYGPVLVGLMIFQIIVCYARIYALVRKQRQQILSVTVETQDNNELRRRKTENKRAYTIALLIVVLFASYCPMSFVSLFYKEISLDICEMSEKTIVAIAWGKFFMLLNSSINPIIYCFRMQDIRTAIRRIFRRS